MMSEVSSRGQELDWRKSRRSMGGGECVEVAAAAGEVLVRDSMNPVGPVLTYSADAWRKLLCSVKNSQVIVQFFAVCLLGCQVAVSGSTG
jgi:hypothetical protein